MNKKHFGLILAGGQGTRFWPWSTEKVPKQFLNIIGEDPLITQTYNRLKQCIPAENIFVVADKKYLDLVREAIPGFKDSNFIDEPSPKNTAPCLILSNIALSQIDEEKFQIEIESSKLTNRNQKIKEILNWIVNRIKYEKIKKKDFSITLNTGKYQFDTNQKLSISYTKKVEQ